MIEKKEDKVRKTLVSQVLISNRIRNLKDHSSHPATHGPPQTTGSKTILLAPLVASARGGSSRGLAPPYCTHCGRKHKGECWILTYAYLVCGSNEHKVKDCPMARSFTAPRTGGIVQQYRKETRTIRVLHHRVGRDKRQRP